MDLRTQFTQLQPVRQLERRIILQSSRKGAISPVNLQILRYALSTAALSLVRVNGVDVDVFEQVAPFRHWLVEQVGYHADPEGLQAIDWKGLTALIPDVVRKVSAVRAHLLESRQLLSEDALEREVTRKRLVLVLGGGGGSGYAHLGAFAVIAELGLTPSMVIGASMGAILGLFRAQESAYDPMATALALPRPSEVSDVFTPYRGESRFGFPGTIELKARSIGQQIFKNLVGRDIPNIDEMPIPYRVVVTGLRTGMGLALTEVERDIARASGRGMAIRWKRRSQLFFGVMRTMLENPRFLKELVFGSDPGLESFNAVDAMGFSAAVPGIIHYDLFGNHDPSAAVLQAVMDQHKLFRLTDGGVVSNVPCRAAWECVQRGEIGSRNAFILAFDAFAPVVNKNAMFFPVQQLIRRSVNANRPYSDHMIAYRQPPSPVGLLQSFESLQQVIARTRTQLKPERAFIEAMMRPVPRWSILESRVNPQTPQLH